MCPGDTFNLTITDATGSTVLIREEITRTWTIDFIASFRFALDDGTVPCTHLAGFFGNSAELPSELAAAVHMDDLAPDQLARFISSVGTKAVQS